MLQEEYDSNIIANFGRDLKKILTSAEIFLTHINAILTNIPVEADNTDNIIETSYGFARIGGDANDIYPISDDRPSLTTNHEHSVLVVDDNSMNRDLLSRYLKRQGLEVITAKNGIQALEMVNSQPFDLILLDILMPGINGYQVLKSLKSQKAWRDIPVIMISALKDMEGVVKCIELGADDYLPKPFNPVVLKARINNCLERKRLSDLEKEHKKMINETFGKYVSHEVRDEVLSGRIPLDGEKKDVTVLFADLRDFTPLTESIPPKEMVRILNCYFTEMAPAIRSRHGSILQYLGDEIYAVFGAPMPLSDHPRQAVGAALDMRQRLIKVNKLLERKGHVLLSHGIGIHSGSVVAANIGCSDRLSYGLVGDTVNLASRIQDLTKKFNTDILVSAQSRARLADEFAVEELPDTLVKGKNSPTGIYKVL
jgi:class 3 adenylate cyclase